MGTVVLGWVLIVVGVISTVAGVTGGIVTMYKEIQRKAAEDRSYALNMLPTEFLKALTEFLNALIKAPIWLALIIIGFALIAWGGTMI